MYVCFDYHCPECGFAEERLVRRDQIDAQDCPSCPGKAPLVRLPSATKTNFRFADTSAHKRARG